MELEAFGLRVGLYPVPVISPIIPNVSSLFRVLLVLFLHCELFASHFGNVLSHSGNVSITREGEQISVSVGGNIFAGDKIRTSAKSEIVLSPKTGSKLTISENSYLKIPSKSKPSPKQVPLFGGKVGFSAPPLPSTTTYAVRNPAAVRGVRTNFGPPCDEHGNPLSGNALKKYIIEVEKTLNISQGNNRN